jgi:hypothetical protein
LALYTINLMKNLKKTDAISRNGNSSTISTISNIPVCRCCRQPKERKV